ncbi:hypothetical protein ACFL56_03400 [Candidatus Margulisiibacteriota bacterium]
MENKHKRKKRPAKTCVELTRDKDKSITVAVPMRSYNENGLSYYLEILIGVTIAYVSLFILSCLGPSPYRWLVTIFFVCLTLTGIWLIFHSIWCLVGYTFVTIKKDKLITGKRMFFFRLTNSYQLNEIKDIAPTKTIRHAFWLMHLLAIGIHFKSRRKPFVVLDWDGLTQSETKWACNELYHFWKKQINN